MLDDIHSPENAAIVIGGAERVMPAVESTGRIVREEMSKLSDQIVQSMPEVGGFARVFGEKDEGRFIILNEPVVIPDAPVGTDGQPRKGLVIITPDGYKVYLRNPDNTIMKTDDELVKFPNILLTEEGITGKKYQHFSKDGKSFIVSHGHSGSIELFDSANEDIPLKAINASISKAQEGPKQTVARNQASIKAARAGQAVIAAAIIK